MARTKTAEPQTQAPAPSLYAMLVRVRGALDAAIAAGEWDSARASLDQLAEIHEIATTKEGT